MAVLVPRKESNTGGVSCQVIAMDARTKKRIIELKNKGYSQTWSHQCGNFVARLFLHRANGQLLLLNMGDGGYHEFYDEKLIQEMHDKTFEVQ